MKWRGDAHPARDQADPLVRRAVLDAERRAQQLTAYIRLVVVAGFVALIPLVPEDVRDSGFPLIAEAVFIALALLSLVLARPRWFRPVWAPVFAVLDVCWFYGIMIAGVLAFGLPPNAFVVLPPALVIFVLIALYGMRYSPQALLAGLITFALLDAIMLLLLWLDLWPGAALSDAPFYGTGASLFRLICVFAAGAITAIASARGRHTLIEAVQAARQRDRVEHLFGRYIPATVAHELVERRGALGPVERYATIMMCDVAGFAGIAETLGPEELVSTMNDYFSAIDQAVAGDGGVVIHFQGDAVLAAFNIPLVQDDHADRAIRCARSIIDLTEHHAFGGIALPTRIGIATGQVVAGNVGGDSRLGYTVYGDTVNQAARLQELGKRYRRPLLVAETTVAHCVEPPGLVEIARQSLRGRSGELTIFG